MDAAAAIRDVAYQELPKMAIYLLSLNLKSAFGRISHERLLYILEE
jgi:hypothetical protein